MNEEARAKIREKMILDLKAAVEAEGGNVTDAVAILGVAWMTLHACGAVFNGQSMHDALFDSRRMLLDNYAAAYMVGARTVRAGMGSN